MKIQLNDISKINIYDKLDYIPVLSTAKNLVDIFKKYISLPKLEAEQISKNHYYEHLSNKSFLRCIILLVPILGNIGIAMCDLLTPSRSQVPQEEFVEVDNSDTDNEDVPPNCPAERLRQGRRALETQHLIQAVLSERSAGNKALGREQRSDIARARPSFSRAYPTEELEPTSPRESRSISSRMAAGIRWQQSGRLGGETVLNRGMGLPLLGRARSQPNSSDESDSESEGSQHGEVESPTTPPESSRTIAPRNPQSHNDFLREQEKRRGIPYRL